MLTGRAPRLVMVVLRQFGYSSVHRRFGANYAAEMFRVTEADSARVGPETFGSPWRC